MFDFAALERRIAALEANRGASLRFGAVTGVNPADGSARVQLEDGDGMVSAPLRVLQRRSLKDKAQCLPDIGEPVACLFAGQGMEAGVVLGAHYSTQTPAPGRTATHDYTVYEDGTEIWYDRKAHKLIAKVRGDAEVETDGRITATAKQEIRAESAVNITLKAPTITLAGLLTVTDQDGRPGSGVFSGDMTIRHGGLRVPDEDVIAGAVSLLKHLTTGVQPGDGLSGVPSGGGAESDEQRFDKIYGPGLDQQNEKESLLLCVPDIAEAEADNCIFENDQQGWRILARMLRRWFVSPPNADVYSSAVEPFWIDWNWVVSFGRVNVEYMDFATETGIPYMLNAKARRSLGNILRANNCLGAQRRDFDFINTEWWQWKALYHTHRPVPEGYIWPDGLVAALEGFTLRALAAGWTEPNESGGHRIHVQRMAVFAHDLFNFEGDEAVGGWNCEKLSFSPVPWLDYTWLTNSDFRNFRHARGRGGDFQVLSKPHIVEFFREVAYDFA